jgi:hypothetical protein
MIGVPVDGTTKYQTVYDALLDEFRACGPDDEALTDEAFQTALDDFFSGVADMSAEFDDSLETIGKDEDLGDMPQAWFLLKWSNED